jgi:hypothetical protein
MGLVFHERAFAQYLSEVGPAKARQASPFSCSKLKRFFGYTADPLAAIGEVGDWLDIPLDENLAGEHGYCHPKHAGDLAVIQSSGLRDGEVLVAFQLRGPQPTAVKVVAGVTTDVQTKPAPMLGKDWWSLEFPLFLHLMPYQEVHVIATFPGRVARDPLIAQCRHVRFSGLMHVMLGIERVQARRHDDKLVVYEGGGMSIR